MLLSRHSSSQSINGTWMCSVCQSDGASYEEWRVPDKVRTFRLSGSYGITEAAERSPARLHVDHHLFNTSLGKECYHRQLYVFKKGLGGSGEKKEITSRLPDHCPKFRECQCHSWESGTQVSRQHWDYSRKAAKTAWWNLSITTFRKKVTDRSRGMDATQELLGSSQWSCLSAHRMNYRRA